MPPRKSQHMRQFPQSTRDRNMSEFLEKLYTVGIDYWGHIVDLTETIEGFNQKHDLPTGPLPPLPQGDQLLNPWA
jgi:hypothetical protein